MKRNLLIVTPVFPRWENDAESPRSITDLARALSQYYRVYVLCPGTYCAANKEHLGDVTIIRFNYFFPVKWQALSSGQGMFAHNKLKSFAKLQLPFYFISEILNLYRAIRQYDIHIVNSHYIFPEGLSYSIIRNFLKRPHVITLHSPGVDELIRHGIIGKIIARFILKHAEKILPVSTYVRYKLERLSGMHFNYKVIPLALDIDDFKYTPEKDKMRRHIGLEKNRTYFLFTGALVERSGIFVLLRAMEQLKKEYTDFSVIVIGNGPLKSKIAKWITQYQLNDHCIFHTLATHERISHYYAACNAVIAPIIIDAEGATDGMPSSVQEGLACGVPVIASRLSGVNDLIKHGVNGWLFEPGNHSELAEYMALLFKPLKLKKLKTSAQKTAERYDSETVANQYYDIFKTFYRIS
ncbi:MAG: glycosyltransferase family 4 protein [Candidatus Auribacter fodinae]|jgi:glycosyltransferase involved in cell wall biosynthesis|uniref:Glycosyltransferase family 4 protein n=1 Tax=Candidatus Auribacter fodinae TaxID=2093366 RepID=A0A3A4RFG6_9BACT|nr:MAG: glycosyltransferase family 4 protein [Candidatus Auribacter fodinae]